MVVTIKKKLEKPLKGGISNAIYIWRTEPGACEVCQELDGTEYNTVDDIPDRPHPNCKCYMDVEKNDNENDNDKNDDSDKNNNSNHNNNSDKVKKEYYDLTDEIIGNCDSLIDEIQTAINELDMIISNETFKSINYCSTFKS